MFETFSLSAAGFTQVAKRYCFSSSSIRSSISSGKAIQLNTTNNQNPRMTEPGRPVFSTAGSYITEVRRYIAESNIDLDGTYGGVMGAEVGGWIG